MNQVLGRSCGNALEVLEAVRFLQGVERTRASLLVVRMLAAELLVMGRLEPDIEDAAARVATGARQRTGPRPLRAHGERARGRERFRRARRERLPAAPVKRALVARRGGWVKSVATRDLGLACIELGGGRHKADDAVDPRVGFTQVVAPGERVEAGGTLAMVHAANESDAGWVSDLLEKAFAIADGDPTPPILVARVGHPRTRPRAGRTRPIEMRRTRTPSAFRAPRKARAPRGALHGARHDARHARDAAPLVARRGRDGRVRAQRDAWIRGPAGHHALVPGRARAGVARRAAGRGQGGSAHDRRRQPGTRRLTAPHRFTWEGWHGGNYLQLTVRPQPGREVSASGTFKTQTHWQFRSDPPALRIAVGSCNYLNDGKYDRPGKPYGGGEEIFDAIAAASPDLMLWLGDNIYLRDPQMDEPGEGINRRYRYYRSHTSLKKLLQAAPHIAIWDDHDFGPDDSDASFVNRPWTLEMFRRYWPLPSTRLLPDALYGMVTQGDVDIFMLDDRSYRYPNRWPDSPEKAMYGPAQMQWAEGGARLFTGTLQARRGRHAVLQQGEPRAAGRALPRAQELVELPRGAGKPHALPCRDAHSRRRIPLGGSASRADVQARAPRPVPDPRAHHVAAHSAGPIANPVEAERNNPDMIPGIDVQRPQLRRDHRDGSPHEARDGDRAARHRRQQGMRDWQATAAQLAEGTRP